MSETCIVCLGDLESANALPHPLVPGIKSEDDGNVGLPPSATRSPLTPDDREQEMIAHLLPCGHDLHNECLKPWVERANSCPICRQSFNQVELIVNVGGKFSTYADTIIISFANILNQGPVISSYGVSDRTQTADIDPSMLIEDYDDEDITEQPCPVCGDDDNEELLLQCDGCDAYYHTYCMGLDDVPMGHWFCETCDTQRAIESVCPNGTSQPVRRAHNPADRRTRGQQRRIRHRNQASSSNWARVWQSVWDNLNLDLDFPFDEGSEAAQMDRAQRAASQRRDMEIWERRFAIAERQGGGNRLRDTASAILDIQTTRERPGHPEPESREEIRAWNAFEKAKEIELDPAPGRRKRKSATASPSDTEPVTQPARPLKRPRTRRNIDPPESSSSAAGEASRSRRGSGAAPSSIRNSNVQNNAVQSNGPSFLQSMLKEIEGSHAPDETKSQAHYSMQYATNHSSPQPSSPGLSPTSSNHATPRARSATPPPSLITRPGSPLSLTSKVEPIYPPSEFSLEKSPVESYLAYRPTSDARQSIKDRRLSRPITQGSNLPRSNDTSPTRNMPLSTKSDLQKMVTAALKPHYPHEISKDQYTDINRNVSRLLYDKVGENGSLDGEAREIWERLARDEVAKAMELLRAVT